MGSIGVRFGRKITLVKATLTLGLGFRALGFIGFRGLECRVQGCGFGVHLVSYNAGPTPTFTTHLG